MSVESPAAGNTQADDFLCCVYFLRVTSIHVAIGTSVVFRRSHWTRGACEQVPAPGQGAEGPTVRPVNPLSQHISPAGPFGGMMAAYVKPVSV